MGKAGENTRTAYHLKRLMDQAGMKPKDVAERYGRGVGYIEQLLHGHSIAGVGTRAKLAKIFNVDESVFLLPPGEEGVPRETDPAKYKQEEVKPHKDGEMIPGSYGVPPLPHQVVELDVSTREDARRRLVEQLDKIQGHREFMTAIAANLDAFARAADQTAEIAALKKRVDDLERQNRALMQHIRSEVERSVPPEGIPERRGAFAAIKKLLDQGDGGPA
jgi:transcriptional regulator with XRE-family HTH domain